MTRFLKRKLFRNERGAAVIELAMVAPVLALMTIGVVDMSNAYSRKLGLEQGTQRAIEKIMQTTGTSTVEGTLKSEVMCQVNGTTTGGACKTSPVTAADITVTYRLECTTSEGATTAQTNTDATVFDTYTCPSGTSEARYIQVSANQKYAPLFPVHFLGFNTADGTYHISATAGMRTQ